MVILIDINILLDHLLKREPFYHDARKVVELCSEDDYNGCIALHTVTTMWYILRKFPEEQRRKTLDYVCGIMQVVGTSHEAVVNAINDDTFKDFEDCVQSKCAMTANADYIITNNIQDYLYSAVPAITPKDYLEILSKEEN